MLNPWENAPWRHHAVAFQNATVLRGAEGGGGNQQTPRKSSSSRSSRKSFRLDYRLEVKLIQKISPLPLMSSCHKCNCYLCLFFFFRRMWPNPPGTSMAAGPTPGPHGGSLPTPPCSGSCCWIKITAMYRLVRRWVIKVSESFPSNCNLGFYNLKTDVLYISPP